MFLEDYLGDHYRQGYASTTVRMASEGGLSFSRAAPMPAISITATGRSPQDRISQST